jgi:hypothetical protein
LRGAEVGKIFREYIKSVVSVNMVGIIPGVGPKENTESNPERPTPMMCGWSFKI